MLLLDRFNGSLVRIATCGLPSPSPCPYSWPSWKWITWLLARRQCTMIAIFMVGRTDNPWTATVRIRSSEGYRIDSGLRLDSISGDATSTRDTKQVLEALQFCIENGSAESLTQLWMAFSTRRCCSTLHRCCVQRRYSCILPQSKLACGLASIDQSCLLSTTRWLRSNCHVE